MGLTLVLGAVLLAGCTLFGPKEDPFADVKQGWGPAFKMSNDALAALPAYQITVTVDTAHKAFTGTVEMSFTVTGGAPLHDLYFRTYPNLSAFGGNLQVNGARVDTKTVNYTVAADGTAVHLTLPDALVVGKRARVLLSFIGSAPRAPKPGVYTIFGYNEEVLSLTNFYPIMAGRRGDSWALDVPDPQGDVGFHDAALYRVTLTAPADQVVITTGTEITRTLPVSGFHTLRYVSGPAREFTVLMSEKFKEMETEALGTQVRSIYFEEDEEAARSALIDAQAALQIYADEFGPYPYRTMTIVQAPLLYHGMEFPSVALIGSLVYNRFIKDLENLVVHEVAHQWWYNQVGSDQVANPWLDEALAEYSMFLYFAGRYGEPVAEGLQTQRWEFPTATLAKQGKDRPVGLTVRDYKENYEALVYGKGALFFSKLRGEMGPLYFRKLLRTYLSRYRWRVASPEDFHALAEEVTGRDLDALFNDWVYGGAPPAAQAAENTGITEAGQ